MKSIRETAAAKALRVISIHNAAGEFIGRVLAHYSAAGTVTVEVYNDFELVHRGRCVGGGYDKFTSALDGAIIDGHRIVDHCGERLETPPGGFPRDYTPPPGYNTYNYDKNLNAYTDCYKRSGLGYLSALGYVVRDLL